MKVEFAFFRPGKERAEYSLDFEISAIPRPGDRIVIRRPETAGEIHPKETFTVRRTEWSLKSPISIDPIKATRAVGSVDLVTVECEFVR